MSLVELNLDGVKLMTLHKLMTHAGLQVGQADWQT